MPLHHRRTHTYPYANSQRTKPRRWPLLLRIHKGAVHGNILPAVFLHCMFTVIIVYVDRNVGGNIGLPTSIIPSLSIVVGLMLVFRNQTSYDRFWTGRNCLNTATSCVRNLTRWFLVCAKPKTPGGTLTDEEITDTECTIRILAAILYAIKHNLRREYNIKNAPALSPLNGLTISPPESPSQSRHGLPSVVNDGSQETNGTGEATNGSPSVRSTARHHVRTYSSRFSALGSRPPSPKRPEYYHLLPEPLIGFEDQGLPLPLQLAGYIESFIQRSFDRGWVHAPGSSGMTAQLNMLIDAYGKMETIRTTPIPVAHLIHQKQVLALFCCILPFATVDDFGWWTVLIVGIISFTLYGIEGIGGQLEDPFGYDKNDIRMDGIIDDTKQEVYVMLEEWKNHGGMFR